MGSVTANVIGNTPIPVAIPRLYKWKEPKNILFATIQLERNPEILNPVFKIAELFNARLDILVFTDTDTADKAELLNDKEKLERYQNVLEESSKEIEFTSVHLKGSDFEDTLQQYIDTNLIDMLVMITQKRSFLEAIFNRSITKKIAYRTTIPLLAVPGTRE